MTLIANAGQWYRMFSQQALIFIASLQLLFLALPAKVLEALVPFTAATTWSDLVLSLTVIAAVLGFIGRLIDQGIPTAPKE